MAKMIRVFECPNCGRRTESRLVNDVPHSFDEDCYECQHCGKIIRVISSTGELIAWGTVAAVIASAIYGSNK